MLDRRKLTSSDDAARLDFISIDCEASSGYIDPRTGISQLQPLRSFPEGERNCYTLKPKQGESNNYLIRAFFAYGNYDAKSKTQTFDLYLNVDFWTIVDLDLTDHLQVVEIIHTLTTDSIHVCLANTGRGTPYISTLELRPLGNSIYLASSPLSPSPSQSLLVLDTRVDVGSTKFASGDFTRFKDDTYDRLWRMDDISPDQGWEVFHRSNDIDVESINDSYKLPKEVLMSATRSRNLSSAVQLDYESHWTTPLEKSFNYYVIFHFVEIEKLPAGQKRVIDITVNGQNILSRPITLEYFKPVTIINVTNQDGLHFKISATSESDARPILNAVEVYKFVSPLASPTVQTDGTLL
ncbi:putative leucine-rich repeat receptor-like protein kinase At2g19210 [Neltuma alba]|uniref:putative leucine-rich repeat receptor-like protein kinase At2g19210 n=1 Tax=Neltuma alba TaxID=207710 RepID=UPI0010A30CBD|nr:putative leucine-rich repeat receptor-like protein kinase At2g19210 [Prosopis alba]